MKYRGYCTIFICFISAASLAGQTASKPFPQNISYPFGFKPTTLDDTLMKSEYKRWQTVVLDKTCQNGYRINCTKEFEGETRVEGIGFGMIISAFMGDKDVFDGLFKFYGKWCTSSAGGLMAWQTTCTGAKDQGSATDGDIDVAFALLVAGWQWGGTYESDAKKVIELLKKYAVKSCGGGILALCGGVSGGSGWGGCGCTDISYYNPAYFRVFAKVTGDAMWDTLAESTYALLNNSANASTGLVPDWQTSAGSAGCDGREATFRYDACRAPWRIAIDYLWNGNEKAKAWCVKISKWANGVGAANIKDGYNLNGTAKGSNHTSSFVGGLAVAAMCNSQEIADAFAADVNKLRDQLWFNICTRLCYLLTMTGNLWRNGLGSGVLESGAEAHAAPAIRIRAGANVLAVAGMRNATSVAIFTPAGKLLATRRTGAAATQTFDTPGIGNGAYVAVVTRSNGTMHPFRLVRVR